MRKIKVGIIQQANTADLRTNLMNLAKSIEACAAHGAQLVVLQELHNSLYFCQTENTQLFDLAETIPGPSTGFYSELAAANKIVLVTSLFEKRAPGLYHNTAVVFDRDGSIAGKYRKMHIPDDPAYYEKFYFTPGDIGFEPIQTSLGKLGVLVCWDQWYPEAARLMALKGAELLIYPTAIGWESSDADDEKARQLNAWIISQRAQDGAAAADAALYARRAGRRPRHDELRHCRHHGCAACAGVCQDARRAGKVCGPAAGAGRARQARGKAARRGKGPPQERPAWEIVSVSIRRWREYEFCEIPREGGRR